jgi:hypothetical protein
MALLYHALVLLYHSNERESFHGLSRKFIGVGQIARSHQWQKPSAHSHALLVRLSDHQLRSSQVKGHQQSGSCQTKLAFIE